MTKQTGNRDELLAFVKERRKMAEPNAHFMKFLRKFETSELRKLLSNEFKTSQWKKVRGVGDLLWFSFRRYMIPWLEPDSPIILVGNLLMGFKRIIGDSLLIYQQPIFILLIYSTWLLKLYIKANHKTHVVFIYYILQYKTSRSLRCFRHPWKKVFSRGIFKYYLFNLKRGIICEVIIWSITT